jgi:hypothetical protein
MVALTSLRTVAVVALALLMCAPTHGQMMQTVGPQDRPAGEVMPTAGTFSIRFPVSFGEWQGMDIPAAPYAVTHMLAGFSSDGILFSAMEIPPAALQKPPAEEMDAFLEDARKGPGVTVSDIRHESENGAEILSFTVADRRGGGYYRLVSANAIAYTQVIQFAEPQRARATEMKDDFFGSFKLKP